jgi:flagellar basal body-associated protein FliL
MGGTLGSDSETEAPVFCPNCGSRNGEAALFCSNCGRTLNSPAHFTPQATEAGRGATILALGILSIVLLGFILGIPAWIMGSRDGRKIRAGVIDANQKGLTQAGMILGIVGTFLSTLWIVALVVIVGFSVFSVRVVNKETKRQGLVAISQSYAQKEASLSFYDDVEQIRGQTTDEAPAIFLMSVSLGYAPTDKDVGVEIGNRRREIHDIVLRDLSIHYDELQAELKDSINMIMKSGKVRSVVFRQFVVQKN